MASRPRRASPSAVHNCCTQCCHALLATCCQRRAARTGNGTHDALLNATLGCRTNCLRDPKNTSRIRRPSTTTTRARTNVARERNVAKPSLPSSLSLHTHCAVAAGVRLQSCHTVVPRCCSLSSARTETSACRDSCRARFVRS